MSSELSAKKARELLENKDDINAEKWYLHWKDNFFEKVKQEALNGNNSINIESYEWLGIFRNKIHLLARLKELGYKVTAAENEYLTISW
jgi:hypothetical protein